MLTLMLTDPASFRMSVKIHLVWASIYLLLFLTDFDTAIVAILFGLGIWITYLLLNGWNKSATEIVTRKDEFRRFVRPSDMADVDFHPELSRFFHREVSHL